jgi:hypothetical protein
LPASALLTVGRVVAQAEASTSVFSWFSEKRRKLRKETLFIDREVHFMNSSQNRAKAKAASRLSLDAWAVIIALLAAALVRFGVLPRVPW